MLPRLTDNFLGYLIDGGIVNPDASISAVNVLYRRYRGLRHGGGRESENGQKFRTDVRGENYKASYDYLIENNLLTAIGMIIVPDDYLEQYPDFTKAVDAEYGSSADGRYTKK